MQGAALSQQKPRNPPHIKQSRRLLAPNALHQSIMVTHSARGAALKSGDFFSKPLTIPRSIVGAAVVFEKENRASFVSLETFLSGEPKVKAAP